MAALHRRRSCNCRSLNCAAVADLSTSGVCRRLSGWHCSRRIKAGAPSRGRTGMTFRSTDFRTYYGFRRRAKARLGSGVRHDHESPSELPLGPRRPLSTPAGCLRHSGLARCCLGTSRGFADFDGIQAERFRGCRSIFISPLRLPISPSGQARQCTWERLLAARCRKAALGPCEVLEPPIST